MDKARGQKDKTGWKTDTMKDWLFLFHFVKGRIKAIVRHRGRTIQLPDNSNGNLVTIEFSPKEFDNHSL